MHPTGSISLESPNKTPHHIQQAVCGHSLCPQGSCETERRQALHKSWVLSALDLITSSCLPAGGMKPESLDSEATSKRHKQLP